MRGRRRRPRRPRLPRRSEPLPDRRRTGRRARRVLRSPTRRHRARRRRPERRMGAPHRPRGRSDRASTVLICRPQRRSRRFTGGSCQAAACAAAQLRLFASTRASSGTANRTLDRARALQHDRASGPAPIGAEERSQLCRVVRAQRGNRANGDRSAVYSEASCGQHDGRSGSATRPTGRVARRSRAGRRPCQRGRLDGDGAPDSGPHNGVRSTATSPSGTDIRNRSTKANGLASDCTRCRFGGSRRLVRRPCRRERPVEA
jgi:hypothetical protein